VHRPCSPTPAGPRRQALQRRRCCPRHVQNEGSRDGIFEAQSHGFCTRCLRFVRRVAPADARLASSCWPLCWAGLATRRIPTKGFRAASYIASPFPRLRLAQGHQSFLKPRCPLTLAAGASAARGRRGEENGDAPLVHLTYAAPWVAAIPASERQRLLGREPAADPTLPWPAPGDSFLEFTLLHELGRGSFSRVFLASQPSLGDRRVALKITSEGSHEAQTVGPLTHRNIVPVYSVGTDPVSGRTAVCMPYLGTATLSDLLRTAFSGPTGPTAGFWAGCLPGEQQEEVNSGLLKAQKTVGLGGIDGAPEALDLHPLSPQRVEIQGKSYDHPRHLQPPLSTSPRATWVLTLDHRDGWPEPRRADPAPGRQRQPRPRQRQDCPGHHRHVQHRAGSQHLPQHGQGR
jgi:hypothetical protein